MFSCLNVGSGAVTPLLRALATASIALTVAGCDREPAAKTLAESVGVPREVRIARAKKAIAARTVSATGTLAADEEIVLGAKVPGRLGEINVDLGSRVRRGQVVARIDPSDYSLRVEQAEAALEQARVRLGLSPGGNDDRVVPEETGIVRQAAAVLKDAKLTHERMVELSKRDLIARAELDEAIAQLTVAEARYQDALEEVRQRQAILAQRRFELEIARQQLKDTAIASPIEAAVRQRHASLGEYLAAGSPVVTLIRMDPLRLRLAVPEREAGFVRVGQQVRLTVAGDPGEYGGRVVRLSPAIAEENRTLLIEAEVPNPRFLLRPGSFAKAEIVVELGEEVVTVPDDALVTFAGIEKVLTVADGKAVERRVRTGRRLAEGVEITEGVEAGEAVIVKPGNLVAGQP
ncbi:MAG TPA: efflux RND transporter periplasmic adaptor subunit, partial [Candidatus Eisenbacteria bacterium]|nr:efflux RND transporter periplasmic adaptor subunit [Candidatus Eisenbacteria bacterium]